MSYLPATANGCSRNEFASEPNARKRLLLACTPHANCNLKEFADDAQSQNFLKIATTFLVVLRRNFVPELFSLYILRVV